MKNIKKYFGLAAGCLAFGAMIQSCAVDEPFGRDGEGVLQMKLVINSELTRAQTDEAELSANCVVYLSGAQGLLYKYQGLENLPEKIQLKNGHYVAEAWTGDSVSASFDSKFYRGYQPFDINGGVENVVVKCRIANVVVSVNSSTIDSQLMKDWNINVAHSRANLDFTSENMDYAKGYFMMPNADKDLTVTVTGTNAEGKAFTKVQTLSNVERAHEYILNFSYNPSTPDPTDGGAFITITVDDTELEISSEVEIYGRPVIRGVEFDETHQILGNAGAFSEKFLKVNAFGGITHLTLGSDDYELMGLPHQEIDLSLATEQIKNSVAQAGLLWDESFNEEKNLVTAYLTLTSEFLNRLPERDNEYVLNFGVTDKYGKTTELPIRIAVGEGAIVIEDPVTIADIDPTDMMAVLSTRATLTGNIINAEAGEAGFRYRPATGGDWQYVQADNATRSKAGIRRMTPGQALRSGGTPYSVTIKGLLPDTRYEYQGVIGDFTTESKYFKTEGKFVIPNASFETWGTYSASTLFGTKTVTFPGSSRDNYYWDSGNEGAATAGMTLTDKIDTYKHSGNYGASLTSNSAMGVIAAGNIFTGIYVKTDGTNGVLSLGRDFDGSHPDKLRVWANYRPGSNVTVKSGNESFLDDLKSGGTDQGQIYVALTTAPIEIRTNPSNRKLFNPDDREVLAYGQVTWKEAFGPDGALQQLDIPLTYNERAASQKPLMLVIVCSASKFGDYFSGAKGSVMYLDDFELIYE